MNKSEQYKLHRLLSQGAELSLQEREKMLADVLGTATLPAKERPPFRMLVWGVGAVSAAAAVALFALFVGLSDDIETKEGAEEFTVKGGGAGGSFRIECITNEGKRDVCALGRKLVFGVLPPKNASYFSAAAVDERGRMIRYFPSETDGSLRVANAGIQSKGIVIGSEHRPGKYRVFGVFSTSGMSIEDMRQVIEAHAAKEKSKVRGVVLVKEGDMEVVSR